MRRWESCKQEFRIRTAVYGGQFTLSTPLIKPNYCLLVNLEGNARYHVAIVLCVPFSLPLLTLVTLSHIPQASHFLPPVDKSYRARLTR